MILNYDRTGRNWKKRYFLLEASKQRLWYFKSKGDCKPRGEILINKSTSVVKSSARENAIEIKNPESKLFLVVSAESKDEFQQWLTALQLVSGQVNAHFSPCICTCLHCS